MLLVKSSVAEKDYVECRRSFKPISKDIELSLDANLSGPNQQQKAFFRQLEADYFSLIPVFSVGIEAEFGRWMKLLLIRNFEAEFQPVYLRIPDCEQSPVAWEIAFETTHDLNHTVTVGMLGYAPQYVRVDG